MASARRTAAAALLSALASPAAPATAATVGGLQFPQELQVDSTQLTLESCGVRDTLWIDHYAAALYLPAGAAAPEARDPAVPKAVMLRIVDDRFLPERIPEEWRGILEQELRAEPMSRIRRAYQQLSAGDTVLIRYVPQQGLRMFVNGDPVAFVGDHSVVDEILGAWAAPDPVARRLRRLALEHPCPP